jgi:hypothetical protein
MTSGSSAARHLAGDFRNHLFSVPLRLPHALAKNQSVADH